MATAITELFDLRGRVAIVTGGAGQLGSAMCDALVGAGARVVVTSRDHGKCQAKASELGEHALAVACDVTNPEDVRRLTATVMEHWGRIDVLVNNAYSGKVAPFESMTLEEFEAAFRGAVSSTFLCSQAVLPHMKAEGKGSIINIASIYGVVAPDQGIYGNTRMNSPCNYGPAKAAVIQFSRWLATYAAPEIRVNAITPGGFYREAFESREDYNAVFVPNYQRKTPLGRMGVPSDLEGAVVYLASDASKWVTGSNLVVDGGWTAW